MDVVIINHCSTYKSSINFYRKNAATLFWWLASHIDGTTIEDGADDVTIPSHDFRLHHPHLGLLRILVLLLATLLKIQEKNEIVRHDVIMTRE